MLFMLIFLHWRVNLYQDRNHRTIFLCYSVIADEGLSGNI